MARIADTALEEQTLLAGVITRKEYESKIKDYLMGVTLNNNNNNNSEHQVQIIERFNSTELKSSIEHYLDEGYELHSINNSKTYFAVMIKYPSKVIKP